MLSLDLKMQNGLINSSEQDLMDADKKIDIKIDKKLKRSYTRYVSQNMFGTVGVSLYLLADTYFISVASGPDGLTALNLALPIYAIIFALGAMIGIGSAIQFRLHRDSGLNANDYFVNAINCALLIGFVIAFVGFFWPDYVLGIMGGDKEIIGIGFIYTRIFMSFAPFFMINSVMTAFVRNDGAPKLAMAATMISSILNILGDYILMFPVHMGMPGAALATSLSPVISIMICLIHFLDEKNTLHYSLGLISLPKLFKACSLGFSAFIGQLSSGVTTAVYNFALLSLSGNTAVAAYGIIANIALTANALFSGLASGAQPILSEFYARGDDRAVRRIAFWNYRNSLIMALLLYGLIFHYASFFVGIFNEAGNVMMQNMAEHGLRIYFTGFLFSGINMAGTEFFSSIGKAKPAFYLSVMRGIVLISISTIFLSRIIGMDGVWISYLVTEGIVMICLILLLKASRAT